MRPLIPRAFANYVATCVACALVLGVLPTGVAHAQAAPTFLDGFFADWTGPREWLDAAGDAGATGIDIRDIDLANDDDNLFIRFIVTAEIGLQEPNSLVLYLDTDVDAGTGRAVEGIGAELEWRFGDRQGTVYTSGGLGSSVFQRDIRLRQLPSVSSPQFEVSLGRDVVPNGIPLFASGAVRVLLLDSAAGGDRAPDVGADLVYNFDATSIAAPTPIEFEREAPGDARFVTWNTRDLSSNGSFNAGASAAANRVFSALDPDVICFQELRDVSAVQTADLIESFLPSDPGEAWHSAQNDDNIVVSRFSILGTWAVDRNLAVLLDADAALGADVLLVNAHFPCCDNNLDRQEECDAVMAFFRDAKSAGGAVTVPSGTIFVLAGDLNLVGFSRQLTTLLTGDILDNGTYGPDFAPDWDGTGLVDVVSRQTERRFAYTWRNDFSSFAPGRLDFFLYNDSAAQFAKSFIIYTPEMSPSQLSRYGLLSSDVTTVSDHLPHVADFRITATDSGAQAAGSGSGLVRVNAVGSPASDPARFVVNLDVAARLSIDVFDVRGALVRTLQRADDRVFSPGAHAFEWDARSRSGRRAANGTYLVRVTATSASPTPNDTVLGTATSKILLLHP